MQYRVPRDEQNQQTIDVGVAAHLFHGIDHGLGAVSLMLGEIQPGSKVRLHRHDYEEVFVINEGQAVFTIGETTVEASAGDIVFVPRGVPHGFSNPGAVPLRQTAVHAASKVAIEWLE